MPRTYAMAAAGHYGGNTLLREPFANPHRLRHTSLRPVGLRHACGPSLTCSAQRRRSRICSRSVMTPSSTRQSYSSLPTNRWNGRGQTLSGARSRFRVSTDGSSPVAKRRQPRWEYVHPLAIDRTLSDDLKHSSTRRHDPPPTMRPDSLRWDPRIPTFRQSIPGSRGTPDSDCCCMTDGIGS